jgi:glutamate-1-semialdehyde aminotransferase
LLSFPPFFFETHTHTHTLKAGIKTLEVLRRPGAYEKLNRLSERLVKGLVSAGQEAGHDICGAHVGGMFGFFFTKGPVKCFEDAAGVCVADTVVVVVFESHSFFFQTFCATGHI